jgi:hypothetical protein
VIWVVKPVQPVAGGGGLYLFRDLAPGQVVRLQLVEPGSNGGIVSLGGRLYRATGVLPARPGERFWALVERVRSDQITVRHISPAQPGQSGVAAGDLARVLGLPAGEDTERVIREFLRWKLPVERESVLRVLAAGRELPQPGCEGFWPALVWLQTLELSPRVGTLGKILAYLLGWSETDLEGQELLNQSRPRPGRDAVQALVLNGGERLQGRLYILSPPAGEVPGAGVRLVLQLRSRALGEFWVCLDFEENVLGGRVAAPEESLASFLRGAVASLEGRLADLGYRVRPLMVETRRVDSVADLLAGSRVTGYVPLDIRV